jgi:hypothetical protein
MNEIKIDNNEIKIDNNEKIETSKLTDEEKVAYKNYLRDVVFLVYKLNIFSITKSELLDFKN